MTLYDHFLLSSELSQGYTRDYTFLKNLIFNLSAAFMGSFFGSLWLVFYVNEKLREQPYGYTLLMVAFSFLVIVAFIALILGIGFVRYDTGYWPFLHTGATEELYRNLSNPFHIKNIIVWANIVLLTQVGLQVNDKFGHGMLWSFVKGKYHHSKKEQRVFMFVDLIGSTGIAEQLGNDRYYELLKDFFADITDSIIYNAGNIYQYVGDEVVISWLCDEKSANHRALDCYFDMRAIMSHKQPQYQVKYGLVPDFKAAIHYGLVTVGEIGIIKKELTFSGDVLNTTSRIMGYCREYGNNLLVSEAFYQYAGESNSDFKFKKMGHEQLRGKSEETGIYTVQQQMVR